MPVALSYYITDRRQLPLSGGASPEGALMEWVRAAFRAGIDYVQIREKDLEGGALSRLVESVVAIRAATVSERPSNGRLETIGQRDVASNTWTPRLLVNERADVARSSGADGVHLPADSLPIAAVRSWAGKNWIVGAACHSIEEVERAAAAGADYALVAPVFDTASKPGMKPMGLDRFREICQQSSIPVFALGGVTLANARSCVDAGASGLAGIRLFQQAVDLSDLCGRLRSL